MKKSSKVIISLGAVAAYLFTIGFLNGVSYSNTEIALRNQFKQKMDERTADYDKMWKIIGQKAQIALKNDSSFARNVNAIMTGRKDSGLFMKWVQETNPNANYDQVSNLYEDLSRAIEGERNDLMMKEKMIQGIVLEHNNLLQQFPGSLWNIKFKRAVLIYKPITSDQTDEVIKSGKDNNTKVF